MGICAKKKLIEEEIEYTEMKTTKGGYLRNCTHRRSALPIADQIWREADTLIALLGIWDIASKPAGVRG
jgi:hypothetical protein